MSNLSSFFLILFLVLFTFVVPMSGLFVWKGRYEALQLECINKGYDSWELDHEHYPPVRVFKLK